MAPSRIGNKDEASSPNTLKRKRDNSTDEDDGAPPGKQPLLETGRESPLEENTEESSPLYNSSDDEFDFACFPQTNSMPDNYLHSEGNDYSPKYDDNHFKNYFSMFPRRSKHNSKRGLRYSDRICPFPSLSWANQCDVWKKMCESDMETHTWTSHKLFHNHPGLQMRMRAILLDWIIEVCEVYKLYRETFHLTVNYIDRYLSSTKDVYKGRLQLIGITCLFIAAKVEEIYPPKIGEFAYVTDGACTREDILAEEMVILQTLDWRTTPNTVNKWLNAYIQLLALQEEKDNNYKSEIVPIINSDVKEYTFIFPQYSSMQYMICGQLIDLAMMHVEVNTFPYSLVAAGAIAHLYDKASAMKVSSYSWEDLEMCYDWLEPFANVLESDSEELRKNSYTLPECGTELMTPTGGGLTKICPKINLDQSHKIQVHNVCLEQFDRVKEHMDMIKTNKECTPTTSATTLPPITPPYSDQKMDSKVSEGKTPFIDRQESLDK